MSLAEVIGADPVPSPKIVLDKGAVYLVGRPGEASQRVLTFARRRATSGTSPGWLEFVDEFDQISPLTDSAVAFLMQKGEFRKVETANGEIVPPKRDLISIDSDGERQRVERRFAYVKVVLALDEGRRRARASVEVEIKKVAKERGEPAPGFTTVLDWVDRYEASSDEAGLASLARKVYRRSDAPPSDMEQAIRVGIAQKIGNPGRTARDAMTFAACWLTEIKREALIERLPDVRSFQRRIALVDRRLRAESEYGPNFAARHFEGAYETTRVERPLEEVEVDHTTANLLLVSDDKSYILGRPDIIAFRDRCTASFLGLSIGFEAPSYASFFDGLQHAMYPKDMSAFPDVEQPWYAWGRFRKLYVDNALHFIGHNVARAADQLKFEVRILPPAAPSLKGGVERLFGILNMKTHKLPGTTYSNVLERRNRAEIAQLPILTLSELRGFLTKWICDEYHVEKHEGLGFLRTLSGIPKVLWDRSISQVPIAPMPDETMFAALAGDVDFRSINAKGIRWDHIHYLNADVEQMRRNGAHKDGREDGLFDGTRHQGSRYRVTRHPFDLSCIWVVNPYLPGKPAIRVPAIRQDYAAGLTLHQHRVNIANANVELLKDAEKCEDALLRARLAVARAISLVLEIRDEQDIERRMARYIYKGREREQRSIVTTKKPDPVVSALPLLASAEAHVEPPATPKRIRTKQAVSSILPAMTAAASQPSRDAGFDPEAFARETEEDEDWRQE